MLIRAIQSGGLPDALKPPKQMKSILSRLAVLFTLLSCAAAADKTLDIYWIDSEGGGSTLIVTPEGESVLIDTGNPGGRDAARIHKVATEIAGLKRIDHVVITHFHLDHFGGAAEIAELMPVGTLYDKGLPDGVPDEGGRSQALGGAERTVSRCEGGEARDHRRGRHDPAPAS